MASALDAAAISRTCLSHNSFFVPPGTAGQAYKSPRKIMRRTDSRHTFSMRAASATLHSGPAAQRRKFSSMRPCYHRVNDFSGPQGTKKAPCCFSSMGPCLVGLIATILFFGSAWFQPTRKGTYDLVEDRIGWPPRHNCYLSTCLLYSRQRCTVWQNRVHQHALTAWWQQQAHVLHSWTAGHCRLQHNS